MLVCLKLTCIYLTGQEVKQSKEKMSRKQTRTVTRTNQNTREKQTNKQKQFVERKNA
jgi:hypothetical protein